MSEFEIKEKCRYWDKCYQKNIQHREKYIHPNFTDKSPSKTDGSTHEKKTLSPKEDSTTTKDSVKRKRSPSPYTGSESHKSPKPRTSKSPLPSEEHNEDFPNELDIEQLRVEVMQNLEGKNYFEIFQRRVRYSHKAEYLDLLKTPEFIRHKWLVEMPEEFYTFWVFCNALAKDDLKPELIFEKFGLQMVGPFEYLSGKFNKFYDAKVAEPGDFLRHWRFYYDPPEFQTIFVKKSTGIHYGYWRDDPKEKEKLLLSRNDANQNCEFEFIGGNCFEGLLHYLSKDFLPTPFTKGDVTKMKKTIQDFATDHNIKLNTVDELKKERNKRVVTKTFHKAGLVVPFDRKTQLGYRPLIESDSELRKILDKFEKAKGNEDVIAMAMEQLQPIITAANIAVDECDFGTSVELGLNLFASGHKELHDLINSLIIPGYSMLKRPQFVAIAKAHLENRRKDVHLSIFDLQ